MENKLPQYGGCTGCGSCAMSCVQKSIVMKYDKEGFIYPYIDETKCISCKKCEKICPVLNTKKLKQTPRILAVKNRNWDIRKKSSSGGVFFELAEEILKRDGYVCGVVYDECFSVHHLLSNKKSDVYKMQGAKYVQSNAWECFGRIKEKLEKNCWILFVGTPCQIAGLKSFLRKEYDKLITVGMICHGVPSPLVWNKYVNERKQNDTVKGQLIDINQRDKISGWSHYGYSISFSYSDGKKYQSNQSCDWFMIGFTSDLFLRPSCYQCKFKGVDRDCDISLGDYWGIWDQYPEFDDNCGVSLMLLHTERGINFWKKVDDSFDVLEVKSDVALSNNRSALYSSTENEHRKTFFNEFENENNISELVKKCISPSHTQIGICYKIIKKLKHFIKTRMD